MKLTLTITTLLLACAAWGQTNETSLFGLSDLENTAGWNFVEEAKNLTAEEKNSFNLMAGDGRGFLGRWHIDAIAANVRALDAQREVEKILAQLPPTAHTNTPSGLILGDVAIGQVAVFTLSDKLLSGELTLSDDAIRKLAKSGAICKVFGHVYDNLPCLYVVNQLEPRKCRLCGKVETKTEEWK